MIKLIKFKSKILMIFFLVNRLMESLTLSLVINKVSWEIHFRRLNCFRKSSKHGKKWILILKNLIDLIFH